MEAHTPHVSERRIGLFRRRVLTWYRQDGRSFSWRARTSRYYKILAEVLLQRTTARAVDSYAPIFVRRFNSWAVLARTPVRQLARALEPLGLYNRRAKSLRALAIAMRQRNGKFPKRREQIEALPGVGQYIANAIELFAHGRARPLLDVNMARVLERFFGPRQKADIRYDPYLQALSQRVVAKEDATALNWAILDLGALICTARRPKCLICPLSTKCDAFQRSVFEGRTAS